jgi:hypothetical protein
VTKHPIAAANSQKLDRRGCFSGAASSHRSSSGRRFARRQPHVGRIGREPDRRAAGADAWGRHRFLEYFKVGAPLTVLTILFGIWGL